MKKTKMQLLAAVVLSTAVLTLGGCQGQGQAPEPAAPTVTEEAVTGTIAETAAETTASEAVTETTSADAGAEGVSGTRAPLSAAEDALLGSFETVTLEGEEVTQDIFGQAKLSMVNIWATYCPPCIEEMPDLAELSAEYGGEDFQMLGLVSDTMTIEDANAVKIVEQTGADYPHILISQELYDNYLYTIQAVPTTVFVDQSGRQVGNVYMGAKSKQQWETIIKELMAETAE